MKRQSKALVIRYGALGDMLIASPVIRLLADKGYKVDVETKKAGRTILKNNPYVNKIILHKEELNGDELEAHWKKVSKGYDKVINLTESIENNLVLAPWSDAYGLTQVERRAQCDKNYYEHTLKLAGFKKQYGLTGEVYLTHYEREAARKVRRRYRKRFLIVWGMSGSSQHKAWPYAEHAMRAFVDAYEDVAVVTVGDFLSKLIEVDHPRIVSKSGVWTIRNSIALSQMADLVVGMDTGFSHGAGIWQTPQILLLSAQTEENISKHWRNCTTLTAEGVDCYPCFKLHYELSTCELDKELNLPKCMVELRPAKVLNAMEDVYQAWRETNGLRDGDGRQKNIRRGRRDCVGVSAQKSLPRREPAGVQHELERVQGACARNGRSSA
ncbi:MAG: glycosyltransferase family 9 protein [Planctomycetota bacterium]